MNPINASPYERRSTARNALGFSLIAFPLTSQSEFFWIFEMIILMESNHKHISYRTIKDLFMA